MPENSEVEQRLMLTRRSMAQIAGVSLAQLDYWAHTGLTVPRVDREFSPRNRVRLYDFRDALSVTVAAELKHRGVSLQHIRRIVEHLHARGYDRPLTELKFATLGGQVYFQHDDGTWEGGIQPDQLVLYQVLDLRPLNSRIRSVVDRVREDSGRIEKRRGVLGSKPVFAGTRIPVDTVRRYLASGRSVDQVKGAYPDLTEPDIRAVQREMVS